MLLCKQRRVAKFRIHVIFVFLVILFILKFLLVKLFVILKLIFFFIVGMVVPSKTKIVCHFSTLVLTWGQPHTLQIVPRDEYDNPTSNSVSLIDEHDYSLSINEVRVYICYRELYESYILEYVLI